MVNYQNGKIYKLVCNISDNVYYGSTCSLLCQRKAHHNDDYRLFINGERKYYLSAFHVIENEDYDIILVEKYPCNSKEELLKRERYYIDNNLCCNKYIPTRTNQEYKKDKNSNQRYYVANKDKIAQHRNIKCECACGGKFTIASKSRHNKSPKHQEFIKLQKYENLKTGLYMIKKLDEYFNKN